MPEDKIAPLIEEIHDAPPASQVLYALKDLPYPFFLDSASSHDKLGRFSFLGASPFLVFKSKRDSVTMEWADGKIENLKANPFIAIKKALERYGALSTHKDIPFTAGAVGYFAYDLKSFIEDLPDIARDDLGAPDCILGFYDTVIIYDNMKGRSYIASSGFPELSLEKNGRRQKERMEEFKAIMSKAAPRRPARALERPLSLESNFSKASYIDAIKKAKDYIKKGDIYQVNLSQRFKTDLTMPAVDLYSRLRTFNPAPFAAFLDLKDLVILSSSPERFLLKRGRYIETRPIKGTRPRGLNSSRDAEMARELSASAKDRAEHIMIVDLERNDLGRICEYGTVRYAEQMILERYASVFHLVSTVTGELKKGVGAIESLLSTFPGGSITGAPKIRSMEIIEALEPVKRSVYTGAIGYISFDGNMDTSIAIRTFVIKDKKVYFQAGGGIVADSVPQDEYEETLHKAHGLMRSLGIATPSGAKLDPGKKEIVFL